MNESVDEDAVRAWAGALSAGLGLVRFGELPKPVFDRLLSSAAYQGHELYVVIAENATQEGLDELAVEFSDDAVVMAAVAKRREQLLGENVVAFPGAVAAASTAPKSILERKKTFSLGRLAARVFSMFDEQPTAFDDPKNRDRGDLIQQVSDRQSVRSLVD